MSESLFQMQRYKRAYKTLEPLFKKPRFQAYTMVVLSLFTISFFGVFALRPTLKTIASLQRQISDKRFVIDKLDQKINSLIKAQEVYQGLSEDLPTIYNLLPETAEYPSLIRKLEILAVESDTKISGIQLAPIALYNQPSSPSAQKNDVSQNPPQSIAITLSLTGSYQNILNFLEKLIVLDRIVKIQSVSLNPQQLVEKAILNLNIQSQAYYYP